MIEVHTSLAEHCGCCLPQPTIAIKNALQEGRPIPWHPRALYRGLAVMLCPWLLLYIIQECALVQLHTTA